ncbi:MAG: class I SAM-dependent methyltransferase [Methanoregulaceae archaeon]|nr:MAG: class I SAM-dependent methyltransferase [Methanoregulaceae archaeon]
MLAGIGDVAATSLVTLYCHAIETRSDNPILADLHSVEIAAELDKTLSRSSQPLARALVSRTLDKNLVIHIAIRAKKYDAYVREFLDQYPDGIVVNIGCGLDSRFLRVDNGRVIFYDLDLPEIIAIKKGFFKENERYHLVASSVLDYGWMAPVRRHKGPFLFMAEGVFMYLDGDDVRSLVLEIKKTFPGSGLVCEVENSFWLGPLTKKILAYKLQHQCNLGTGAMFRSGIRDSREMEQWESGIQFLDDWSYFDADEKKLGWLRVLRHIGWIRKTQWTVHYRLG